MTTLTTPIPTKELVMKQWHRNGPFRLAMRSLWVKPSQLPVGSKVRIIYGRRTAKLRQHEMTIIA